MSKENKSIKNPINNRISFEVSVRSIYFTDKSFSIRSRWSTFRDVKYRFRGMRICLKLVK
jgi:hypothetical protein